jgi:putative membrane protein
VFEIKQSVLLIDDFLLYFVLSLVVFGLAMYLYMRLTPHQELPLIRQGNTAAAISLAGAMLGFVLPLASVVANSVNLGDLLLFAVIALIAQALVFLAMSRLMPGLSQAIEEGNTARATLLAASSISVGVLNAAALVY